MGSKKECNTCNKLLDLSKFNTYLSNKGEIRYRNKCGVCRGKPYYTQANTRKRAKYDPKKKQKYYLNNTDTIKSRTSKRHVERRQQDILYKLRDSVGSRTRTILKRKNWNKINSFTQYIGCTAFELKTYLEKQFIEDMSWDNHGKWHIDHIIPLASAKTEEELYKLCHYTNLQPLWAEVNKRKGAKIISSPIIMTYIGY